MDFIESLSLQQSIVELTKQIAALNLIMLEKGVITEEEFIKYKEKAQKMVDEKLGENNPQTLIDKMESLIGKFKA